MASLSLPPALDKSRHTIARETAFLRKMTPGERLRLLSQVCKASLKTLRLNPHADQLLRMRDPLPPTTVTAFKRLHGQLDVD